MRTLQQAIDWAMRPEPPDVYISCFPKKTQNALLLLLAEVQRLTAANEELTLERDGWQRKAEGLIALLQETSNKLHHYSQDNKHSEITKLIQRVEAAESRLSTEYRRAIEDAEKVIDEVASTYCGTIPRNQAEETIAALRQLSPKADTCEWTYDDNEHAPKWDSSCGEAWCFIEGGPKENRVRFCQGCGLPITIKEAHGEEA